MKNLQRGFTVIELLVAAVLIAVVVVLAFNYYIFARDVWITTYVQGDLQREGIIGLEKMIHGVQQDRKGIQEAREYNIISPSHISFVGTRGLTRQFYRSGDKVVYVDKNGITSDLISGDVAALTFGAPQDDVISINLKLERTVFGRIISVELPTSVELRNR